MILMILPTNIETAEQPVNLTQGVHHAPQSRFEQTIPWLIFVGCFAYLCAFLRYSTLEPDEGIVLRGAERILQGQLPYRDFFSFYTPGSFYLVASLFRLFGDSFAVARMSLAVAGGICSAVTYVLSRRVCPTGISVLSALLATSAGVAFRFLVLHNIYSTVGCCLCLYVAIRFLETARTYWAFVTGTLASLTFLTEQSKGSGLYLGLAVGFATLVFFNKEFRPHKTAFIVATVGVMWPLGATFAFFAIRRSLKVMLQCWLWPVQHYTQANHVPYGYQNWSDHTRELIFHTGPIIVRIIKVTVVLPGLLIPVLPIVAIGILALSIVSLKRKCASYDIRYYLLVSSVVAGLVLSVVIVRADIIHFMYLAPLWYLVLAWILGARNVGSPLLSASRVPLTAFVALTFGLLSMALLSSATGAHNRIETRRGSISTGAKEDVIEYVQTRVHSGGNLLVYPYLPLYNFLTATTNPSRFDFFQPGMNTEEQAEEIIRSLQTSLSPVLFEPQFEEKIANSWPQTPFSVFARDPVSDFIARNYRVCGNLTSPEGWRLEFMVRKESACR
jgi:hypothetical protein